MINDQQRKKIRKAKQILREAGYAGLIEINLETDEVRQIELRGSGRCPTTAPDVQP